jgi:hypothetical protein
MTEFLLELYIPRADRRGALDSAQRASRATEQLHADGVTVRCLRAIFVPEDETCFLVFEAESADNVRRAARLAGLSADHVVETLAVERQAS